MMHALKDFLKLESASGVALLLVSALALLLANSPWAPHYDAFVKPSAFWINDALMALFFLLVGIEIKREVREGELSTRAGAMLPVVAALGGIVVPAIIYSVLNWDTPALRGWAIPSATDIAFSLGVLALLGSRVAPSLKVFLMAVAIIDDLVAVLIIALFYTEQLSAAGLAGAAACIVLLAGCNRNGVQRAWPYLALGAALWVALLKAGIHPTIAGVVLGALLPLSLGKHILEKMHIGVAFGIVPLFAFVNAGVSLHGISVEQLTHPVPLGIALGLFAGKQLGIFTASWLLIRCRLASLPSGASWGEFYGVCMLAGIGFTMSLFIGMLAFFDSTLLLYMRLGVIVGSLFSAIVGYAVLSMVLNRRKQETL